MTKAEFIEKLANIMDSGEATVAGNFAADRQLDGLNGRYCMADYRGVRVSVRIGETPMQAINRKLGSRCLHQDSYDMHSYHQFKDGSVESSNGWFVLVSSNGSIQSRGAFLIGCALKHYETLGEYVMRDGTRLQITE